MPKDRADTKIVVSKDGPYVVSSVVPLTMDITRTDHSMLRFACPSCYTRHPESVPGRLA
jgi:hypothetical protein